MPLSNVPVVSGKISILLCCWMFCFASRQLRTLPAARAFSFAPFGRNNAGVLGSSRVAANTIFALSTTASAKSSSSSSSSTTTTTTTTTTTRLRSTLCSTPTMDTNNATNAPAASTSTSASTLSSPRVEEYPIEMTEDERYLFDLNGYLIVRGVLSPEEVAEANAAIDRHAEDMVERSDSNLRNAKEGTRYYGQGPGRMDLGRCLEWGETDSRVFKSVLAHPRLVPIFHGILGKGYRMDHLPMVLAQNKGSEGFQLHGGTIDCTSGAYNPFLAYHCHHGTITTALLGCNVILRDHNPGDGGFCIVPGSHKSNFKMPKGMVDGEKYEDFVIQPATKAGDVVLFSEGTVHGAKPWTSDEQRRTALFRFSPATNVYGRSYFGHEGGGWPDAMYENLTPAQRAVLEPPYANRLDRPNINDDCESVEITTRNARKRQHDQDVFGTKYF